MADIRYPVRRQYARFKINAYAGLRARGPALTDMLLKNISAQGACGVVDTPVGVNQVVEVVIKQPTVKNMIKEKARVVWQKSKLWGKREIGLKFEYLDLSNFTQKLIPAQDEQVVSKAKSIALPEAIDIRKIVLTIAFLILLFISLINSPIFQNPNSPFFRLRNPLTSFRSNLGFQLEGIVYDPAGRSVVTINGEIVSEGETYKGRLIRRINRDSIVVTYRGTDKVLYLAQEPE